MVEERLIYADLQIDQAYAVADLRWYRPRNIVVTQVPEQQAPSPCHCKATSYKGHRGKTENWTFKKTWHNQNSAQLQQYRSLCRLVMVVGLFMVLVCYKFWRLCKLPIDGEISPASAKSERFLQTRNKNLFFNQMRFTSSPEATFSYISSPGDQCGSLPSWWIQLRDDDSLCAFMSFQFLLRLSSTLVT